MSQSPVALVTSFGYVAGRHGSLYRTVGFLQMLAISETAAMGELDDLPVYSYSKDGEARMKPCAEAFVSDLAAEAFLERGIMPLVSIKNRDAARLLRWQSIALSGTASGTGVYPAVAGGLVAATGFVRGVAAAGGWSAATRTRTPARRPPTSRRPRSAVP